MTKDQLKSIFSRFQNLNLLRLRDDLLEGRVARHNWFFSANKTTCPIRHGESGRLSLMGIYSSSHFEDVGIPDKIGYEFLIWWDGGMDGPLTARTVKMRTKKLLVTCNEILDERMDDALAVQEMIQPQQEPVLA